MVYLVANKCDLPTSTDQKYANYLASKYGMKTATVSAKTGFNVNLLLE